MNKQGQVAAEFMTTYGWSVLTVVVLFGVLTMVGVFSFDRTLPEYCLLSLPFQCLDISYIEGDIVFFIKNGDVSDYDNIRTNIGEFNNYNCSVLSTVKSNGYGQIYCTPYQEVNDYIKEDFMLKYTKRSSGFEHESVGSIAIKSN